MSTEGPYAPHRPRHRTIPWRQPMGCEFKPAVALREARTGPVRASIGMTETQTRVAANALVFGYFGALEQ
jgi:hypothetical protein